MASFDLKTAISLLPIMNDTEEITNKLIDATELYDSMLNDAGKPLLIKFILKTRLSNSAKLRLKNEYDTVNNLVADIRTHLLTRQSDTALQFKMLRSKQGEKSIEDFGKELEDLFVNLTISQANGNNATYDILRPINEKSAIKRFADGLRNPKLSTIISSRNFLHLKDAIRAAQDEEIMSPSNFSHVMTFSNRGRGNSSRNYFNNHNRRMSGNKNNYFNRNVNRFHNDNRSHYNNNNNQRFQHFSRNSRGRSFNSSNRRGSRGRHHNLHFADLGSDPGQEHVGSRNSQDLSQTFFRA